MNHRSFPTTFAHLLALALVLLLAASPARPASAVQVLRVNTGIPFPDTLDPVKASFVQEVGHLTPVFEGLTRLDDQLHVVPAAAESISYSTDGLTVTFTLRADLKYADGSLLNAMRFEYAILRALDPTVGGQFGSYLDNIVGAYEYSTADPASLTPGELAALRAAVQVRALNRLGSSPCTGYSQVDCRVLRVTLKQRQVAFFAIMSLWFTFPARQELIEGGGEQWWQDPARMVGNGPFILQSLNSGGHSTYGPNPHYWRGAPGYELHYSYITVPNDALAQYEAGALDITPAAFEILDLIRADPALSSQLKTSAGSCTYGVMMNSEVAPFDDIDVRTAFALAFDRDRWLQDLLGGVGVAALSWIPQGVPGHDAAENRLAFNPQQAQQALARSKYGGPAGLPPIRVQYLDSPRNTARWTWLRDQFASVLGVTIELEPGAMTPDTPMRILGWCGDYPDTSNYLSTYWRSSSTFAQRIHYANPAVDALLDQADGDLDPVTRLETYIEAQRAIIGDVPFIPGWYNQLGYLVKPHLTAPFTSFDALFYGQQGLLEFVFAPRQVFLPMLSNR